MTLEHVPVWNGRGRLSPQALELLNHVARREEIWMYPLSQLASDMGRAKLLVVHYIPATAEAGAPMPGTCAPEPGTPTSDTGCAWVINVAENGWFFVTDEVGLYKRRKRIAFKKLGGHLIPEVPSKPPPDDP